MAKIIDVPQAQPDLPSLQDYLNSQRAAAATSAPATPQPSGAGNWLSAGLGAGFMQAGAAASRGAQALMTAIGQEGAASGWQQEAASLDTKAATYQRPDLEDAGMFGSVPGFAYNIAKGLPMMGGAMIGGALAAAAAPDVAGAGLIGGAATLLPGAVGENIKRHEDEVGDLTQGQAIKAIGLGVPEAALQGVMPAKITGSLGHSVVAATLKQGLKGAAKEAGVEALTQAGAAGATDFLTGLMGDPNRTMGQRAQSFVDAALQGGAQGALFGAGAYGVRAALHPLMKAPPAQVGNADLVQATDPVVMSPAELAARQAAGDDNTAGQDNEPPAPPAPPVLPTAGMDPVLMKAAGVQDAGAPVPGANSNDVVEGQLGPELSRERYVQGIKARLIQQQQAAEAAAAAARANLPSAVLGGTRLPSLIGDMPEPANTLHIPGAEPVAPANDQLGANTNQPGPRVHGPAETLPELIQAQSEPGVNDNITAANLNRAAQPEPDRAAAPQPTMDTRIASVGEPANDQIGGNDNSPRLTPPLAEVVKRPEMDTNISSVGKPGNENIAVGNDNTKGGTPPTTFKPDEWQKDLRKAGSKTTADAAKAQVSTREQAADALAPKVLEKWKDGSLSGTNLEKVAKKYGVLDDKGDPTGKYAEQVKASPAVEKPPGIKEEPDLAGPTSAKPLTEPDAPTMLTPEQAQTAAPSQKAASFVERMKAAKAAEPPKAQDAARASAKSAEPVVKPKAQDAARASAKAGVSVSELEVPGNALVSGSIKSVRDATTRLRGVVDTMEATGPTKKGMKELIDAHEAQLNKLSELAKKGDPQKTWEGTGFKHFDEALYDFAEDHNLPAHVMGVVEEHVKAEDRLREDTRQQAIDAMHANKSKAPIKPVGVWETPSLRMSPEQAGPDRKLVAEKHQPRFDAVERVRRKVDAYLRDTPDAAGYYQRINDLQSKLLKPSNKGDSTVQSIAKATRQLRDEVIGKIAAREATPAEVPVASAAETQSASRWTPTPRDNGRISQHDIDIAHIINSTGSGDAALEYLQHNGSSTLVREMAAVLRGFGVDPRIQFADPASAKFDNDRMSEPGARVMGSYNSDDQRINVYHGAYLEATVLHEALHAATQKALLADTPAGKALKELFERVKARSPDNNAYGLTNVKEFVAEALSNQTFKNFLQGERVSTGSRIRDAWQSFKNGVFRLLGMPERQRSLFDQVLDHSLLAMNENANAKAASGVETPAVRMETGLKNLSSVATALKSKSQDSLVGELAGHISNIIPKAREQMLSVINSDHIASLIGDRVKSAPIFNALMRDKPVRAGAILKHNAVGESLRRALPHAEQDRVAQVMTASLLGLRPDDTWERHAHLQDVPNKADLRASHREFANAYRALSPEGKAAYQAMAASNRADNLARLAFNMRDVISRNGYLQALPFFNRDAIGEYKTRFAEHDNPALAEKFFRDYVNDGLKHVNEAFGIATSIRDDITGKLDTARKNITDLQKDLSKLSRKDPTRAGVVDQLKAAQTAYDSMKGTRDDLKFAGKVRGELKSLMDDVGKSIKQMEEGNYFHLGRTGDYFVSGHVALGADGLPSDVSLRRISDALKSKGFNDAVLMHGGANSAIYMRLDNPNQVQMAHDIFRTLQQQKHIDPAKEVSSGLASDPKVFSNVAPEYIRRAIEAMRSTGPEYPVGATEADRARFDAAHEQHMGDLTRQWMHMMPENAITTIYQHRKDVQGFSANMGESYARAANTRANGLAAMSLAADIGAAQKQMRDDVRAINASDLDAKQKVAYSQNVNELMLREQLKTNTTPNTPFDFLRTMSHTIHVGLSPMYGVTVGSQAFTLTLPEFGKTHGYIKSAQAMAKVTPMSFKVVSAIGKSAEATAFTMRLKTLQDAGVPDNLAKMLLHQDAMGSFNITSQSEFMVGHGGTGKLSHAVQLANMMGRYSEMLPRIQAALMAHELYRGVEKDGDYHAFINKKVNGSQLDWSAANTARAYTKGGQFGAMSPLLNQFMGFKTKMTEKLYREVLDSFAKPRAGETPEQARQRQIEGRKWLLGHLAATTMIAGTLGSIPMVTVMATVYDRLADWATDSDSHDIQASYRTWLAGAFGKQTGEIIARGLPRAMGMDFDHLGEGSIAPGSSVLTIAFEKRKLEDMQRDFSKAMMGSAAGFAFEAFSAVRDALNGDYLDGLIRIVPEAFKTPLEGYRLAQRGFVDRTGAKLPITANAADIAMVALGFDPAKEAEYDEQRGSAMGLERMRELREQNIEKHLQLAINRRDQGMYQSWVAEAQQFTRDHPGLPSPLTTLGQSLTEHARAAAMAKGLGMPVGVNPRDLVTRGMASYGNLEGR